MHTHVLKVDSAYYSFYIAVLILLLFTFPTALLFFVPLFLIKYVREVAFEATVVGENLIVKHSKAFVKNETIVPLARISKIFVTTKPLDSLFKTKSLFIELTEAFFQEANIKQFSLKSENSIGFYYNYICIPHIKSEDADLFLKDIANAITVENVGRNIPWAVRKNFKRQLSYYLVIFVLFLVPAFAMDYLQKILNDPIQRELVFDFIDKYIRK